MCGAESAWRAQGQVESSKRERVHAGRQAPRDELHVLTHLLLTRPLGAQVVPLQRPFSY